MGRSAMRKNKVTRFHHEGPKFMHIYYAETQIKTLTHTQKSGFGGLEVACWPLVPKFAGSNPAEAVGFF